MRIGIADSVKPWRKSTAITGPEFKVLELAAMGYSDSNIGLELGISRDMLTSHWRRILPKLGAANRDEALTKYSQRPHVTEEDVHGRIRKPFLPEAGDRENAQKNLLDAITNASLCYINGGQNVRQVYSRMLDDLMALTSSQYGLIGEVHMEGGIPYLGEHALTCASWDDVTQAHYEAQHKEHVLFRHLDGHFGETIKRREIVVSNDAQTDSIGSAAAFGHPNIETFIGIPVYSGLDIVAIIGLANRAGGYPKEFADFLKPIVSTCANITVAWRLEISRRRTEKALDESTSMMRTLVDRTPSAVLYETADRRLEFINARFAALFGIEAAPSQIVGIDASLVVKHSKQLFSDPIRFYDRVEDLIAGQESYYGELVEMADGRLFQRDFLVVRSGAAVCGYFWHYRQVDSPFDE